MKDKYPEVKIGDMVVKFSYWNSTPQDSGEVIAQTDHFVQIIKRQLFGDKKKWISKDRIEIVR